MSAPTMRKPVTRKRRRLYAVLAGLTMLGVAAALVLVAFEDTIVFFYSPSDLVEKTVRPGQTLRVGGLVVEGSVKKAADGITTIFDITDLNRAVQVRFTGLLPDLFREGQGIISEGTLRPDGVFMATSVLAKHDENYMPKEVADALKRSGKWKQPMDKPEARK
jgi:cytochrome c-type biogenesis protein CcmE